MKSMSILLWGLLAGLLVVSEDGEAAPYTIIHLEPSRTGGFKDDERLGRTYRDIWWIGNDTGLPHEVYSKVVDTGLSAQRAYPSFNSAQPIKSPRCEGERIRSSCKNIPPLRWLG